MTTIRKPHNPVQQAKQRGLSPLGWLVVLMIFAAVATCAVKIVPLYVNHNSLYQAIKSAALTGQSLGTLPKSEIRRRLQKTFLVNNIELDLRDFEIEKANGEVMINYQYESRVHLFYNLDVVAIFDLAFSTADL